MHARNLRIHGPILSVTALISLAASFSGCGTDLSTLNLNGLFPGLDPGVAQQASLNPEAGSDAATGDAPAVVEEQADPHNAFDKPQTARMRRDDMVTIQGRIDGANDIDLYDLGPASAGDRITIEVAGDNGLNTNAALFDANGNLIDANDDRSYYGGRLDPYISDWLWADTPHVILGIAVSGSAYFASTQGRYDSGTYSVKVTHHSGDPAPAVHPQVAWLDFEGGDSVQIGAEPVEQMRPFSAESISTRLAGQTPYIADSIIEHMKADFAPYNVILLNSKHDPRPTVPVTRVYFGNFNRSFLGLSDNVDTGNRVAVQEAIVYAEDIGLFENLRPSADEVAQALANTGAHELGHLLGLQHTADPQDLMSTAATARQVLENDESFLRASLNAGVFPVGWQNDPITLIQNVGRNPIAPARARREDMRPKPDTSFRDSIDLSNLPVLKCGRCVHDTEMDAGAGSQNP